MSWPRGCVEAPRGLAEPSRPGAPSPSRLTLPGWARAPTVRSLSPDLGALSQTYQTKAQPRSPGRLSWAGQRPDAPVIGYSRDSWNHPPCHCQSLGGFGVSVAVRAQRPGWSVLRRAWDSGQRPNHSHRWPGSTIHQSKERQCPRVPAPTGRPDLSVCVSPRCPQSPKEP